MTNKEALEIAGIHVETIQEKTTKEALKIALQALKEKVDGDWISCEKQLPKRKWVVYTPDAEEPFEKYESDPVLVRTEDAYLAVAVFSMDEKQDKDCWNGWQCTINDFTATDKIKEWRKI